MPKKKPIAVPIFSSLAMAEEMGKQLKIHKMESTAMAGWVS